MKVVQINSKCKKYSESSLVNLVRKVKKKQILFLLRSTFRTSVFWKSANRQMLASNCGAGHYYDFLNYVSVVLYWIYICFRSVQRKLIGKFYNNSQSAANSYMRFAYSFVSLMLLYYYRRCDFYSTDRQSAVYIKNSRKLLIGAANPPASQSATQLQ